jgi:hypothetical protein
VSQRAFAALEKLAPADLFTHAKSVVKLGSDVEKAKSAFTEDLKFSAKVAAAMKRLYVQRLNKREIPADTAFKKFWEQNAGDALPGRVEAVASLFNAMVLTVDANGNPLISEETFDAAAVDWLEKANAIVKDAMKKHGDNWKTCDEVLDVINALSKPGDAGKKLKEIRKRQKGGKADSESETAQAPILTVGMAVEFLISTIKGAGKWPEEQGAALFADTVRITDAWAESGLSDDTLNQWANNIGKGVAPHLKTGAQTPAVLPKPEPAAIAA